MSWKLIESRTLKPNHGLVSEFATMTPAKADRNILPSRMALLRKEMLTGRFRTAVWASAFCKDTKQTYRVNGKHTSTLLSQMNGEAPKDIKLYVERYDCDTLEDVAALYATFDAKWSARSAADINKAFAASVPELEDIPTKIINTCVTGMAIATWGASYGTYPADQRAQFIIAESDFIVWASQILGGDQRKVKHLLRGAVVAAMYKTWKIAKTKAAEFWSLVLVGEGKVGSPERKLEKLLLTTTVNYGNGARGLKPASVREILAKCIHGWNAWATGTTSELKYFPKADLPEVKKPKS